MEEAVRLGISTCLLGERVRYDGGHKLDRYLVNTLGQFVEFVPVCPEVECGLPVPRESLRLVGEPEAPRLVTTRTHRDETDRMVRWARRRVVELEREDLCGFIFKSRSPSSGMARVKLYGPSGVPSNRGVGMFARAFMEHFPHLPVEEEGRLGDPVLREAFIERIFAFRRWRALRGERRRRGLLVAFHTRHKLQIQAHSPQHLREMGRVVAASSRELDLEDRYGRYLELFLEALQRRATVRKHAAVLTHMLGYFKKQLAADEKQEILEILHRYRDGLVPLIVPITLVNHYVRKYREPYLSVQHYLRPHPLELRLRNHV